MALGDWISGLFQSEQTRGLSGGSAPSIALDDANPYYNYRLRRHRAEGDLISDPALLWYTSPFVKQRSGLGTHVASEIGDGQANYTDVLIVLSRADHTRATETDSWFADAQRALGQEFETLCRREGLRRRFEHRPLGFRFIADGDEAMGATELGLEAGEFVTGLLPNLYTGPVRGSWPVLSLHLNIPGAWEGYREVGRLHNDQRLFTLGSHWLDNFGHPALREASLYRLQQYPDGSFVHIVNPDLQDRYQVTSEDQEGAHVLTLATRSGEPLAYLVLVAEEPPASRAVSLDPEDLPTGPSARPPIPSVAPPMLLDKTDEAATPEQRTILPEGPSERIFTLQERGVLLQRVHFSAFMQGYDVYFGRRGELGTVVEDPAATFQVRRKSVSLVPHVEGVVVDGETLPVDTELEIRGDARITVEGQRLEYRDLRGLKGTSGWPYVGEIRRPASSTYMIWGDSYQVGRSRDCRVVLPDETRNDNIRWKAKVGDGATIRARTGEIPKSKFYTDSIMVASEHASVDLRDAAPRIVCNARHCYVYVRRGEDHEPLYPTTSPEEPKDMDLSPGDEILIGNCLFHVGFTPAEAGTRPAPAPPVSTDAEPAPAPPVSTEPEPAPSRRLDPGASLSDAPPLPALRAADLSAPSLQPRPLAPPPPALRSLADVPSPHSLSAASEGPPAPATGSPPLSSAPPPPPRVQAPPPPASPPDTLPDEPTDLRAPEPTPQEDDGADAPPGAAEPQELTPIADLSSGEPHEDDAPTPLLSDIDDEETIPDMVDPFRSIGGPPPVLKPDVGGWDEDWQEPVEPPPLASSILTTATASEVSPTADTSETQPVAETAAASEAPARRVIYTDDREAQFELGRPLHVVLAGWMLNGEAVCGNHTGADFVLPENRVVEEQSFEPTDYFRLKVRGRRGKLTVLAPSEVLIDEDDPTAEEYTNLEEHTFDVVRRDELGDEDFSIRLSLTADRSLPDPRARLLSLDYEDPLAAALVTRGLPKGTERQLDLGGITMTLRFDGETVHFSDYLDTYRQGDQFKPFFVQRGDSRFKTAPEDGTVFQLQAGDRLVVGTCVYVLLEE